jgi:hypothetical protein
MEYSKPRVYRMDVNHPVSYEYCGSVGYAGDCIPGRADHLSVL